MPTGNLWRNSDTPTRERPYFSVKIDAETAKMGGGLCDIDVGTCMLDLYMYLKCSVTGGMYVYVHVGGGYRVLYRVE